MTAHGDDSVMRLLGAIASIGSWLDLHTVLQRVVDVATEVVGARYGALGVLDGERIALAEFVTSGMTPEQEAAVPEAPKGHGILGILIGDPRPLRLDDLTTHAERFGFPPGHPPMTSFLGVPIVIGGEAFGNLYLTDKVEGGRFTEHDEELAVALADAAAAAIDNARLHARAREIERVEDRERIARELHDTVIQRLYATGLSLQAALRFVVRDEAIERVARAIDDLDETMREIRGAIFELHQPVESEGVFPAASGGGFRRRVMAVAREQADALGFEPVVRFHGPVDTLVSDEVADHAVAVVREGLANVARHAKATSARVQVVVDDGLTVEVIDDGIGPDGLVDLGSDFLGETGHGLRNVAARAREFDGDGGLVPGDGGGAVLRWTVVLPD